MLYVLGRNSLVVSNPLQGWFEVSFLSLRPVAILRLKSLVSNYLLTAEGESSWIHTFPIGISLMWYANILVQDLNLSSLVHILQQ